MQKNKITQEELKEKRQKKVKETGEVQKVEVEKPFRMPTTAIRMYHKGQWKNCSSDDVELTWDHF